MSNEVSNEVSNNSYTVLDMFSGCGGSSKGLSDSGLEVLCGIDNNPEAISNYKKNFKHLALCEDLTTLGPETVSDLLENKQIDIITASPPCQNYSMAGRRKLKDPKNDLFKCFVKYLNYFKPKAFIMENVMGMLSMIVEDESGIKSKVIDLIMGDLNQNYNTIICKLYASDFEVPQNRRRVIIFGLRKDLNKEPTEPQIVSNTRLTVSTILEKKEDVPLTYYLSAKALAGIAKKKENSADKGQGFGAQYLDLDKPSYTIPARYWKDGYDALVKYSETSVRRLTIKELKRIQTFPDSFILEGSKKDIITQIGNAVACKFAYHIGLHVQKMLKS